MQCIHNTIIISRLDLVFKQIPFRGKIEVLDAAAAGAALGLGLH